MLIGGEQRTGESQVYPDQLGLTGSGGRVELLQRDSRHGSSIVIRCSLGQLRDGDGLQGRMVSRVGRVEHPPDAVERLGVVAGGEPDAAARDLDEREVGEIGHGQPLPLRLVDGRKRRVQISVQCGELSLRDSRAGQSARLGVLLGQTRRLGDSR
ncbi:MULTISPECIES: hypothetical protein [unclassified Streptomyces]|uniref:hypothetical protein n=1 Tax=unclassified Streptomyces TaxID=2593676 RepID=UPI002E81718E|nr:hypothetical protein [Streptomyces sp. NBC_00589]WTI41984.1 hypothetical protein OIC96_47000 [Streptomyces sp. NBC_00775]WUB24333.1 hypothetical protein OHA51_02720 [Streptomyces sp. NBC_00589]